MCGVCIKWEQNGPVVNRMCGLTVTLRYIQRKGIGPDADEGAVQWFISNELYKGLKSRFRYSQAGRQVSRGAGTGVGQGLESGLV